MKEKKRNIVFKNDSNGLLIEFFHISHQTMNASNKKNKRNRFEFYHHHTSCSQALPCEPQRDSDLREASQMLATTNNRKSFHKAEKLKL